MCDSSVFVCSAVAFLDGLLLSGLLARCQPFGAHTLRNISCLLKHICVVLKSSRLLSLADVSCAQPCTVTPLLTAFVAFVFVACTANGMAVAALALANLQSELQGNPRENVVVAAWVAASCSILPSVRGCVRVFKQKR